MSKVKKDCKKECSASCNLNSIKILLQAPFVVLLRIHGLTQTGLRSSFSYADFALYLKLMIAPKLLRRLPSSQPVLLVENL